MHEQTRPTRRTVARAAAWTVPVVAVATAAPAFAASPCDQRLNANFDWDGPSNTFSRTSSTSAVATYDPDGSAGPVPALTLTAAASYTGNMKSGAEFSGNGNNNFTLATQVGGLGISGLQMEQATTSTSPQGYNDRGTYTFTFSRPVTNLQFTITDIDSQSDDFLDLLVPSAGYTVVSKSPTVQSGTSNGTQFFYQQYTSNPYDNVTSNGGNLELRYAGPLTSFSITYSNYAGSYASNIDTNQAIFLTDLRFDYKPC